MPVSFQLCLGFIGFLNTFLGFMFLLSEVHIRSMFFINQYFIQNFYYPRFSYMCVRVHLLYH